MSRRMSPKRRGERGFTMIEAVVALALVMIGLAAIGTLAATNSRGAWKLEQRAALADTARLVASTIPRAGVPIPEDLAGNVASHRWQMRVTPFLGEVPEVPQSRFIPQRVELRVRAPSGAILSLETVRLQLRSGGG
ncbi:general secretion pathway protein GspI [Bradyrhizobium betae]|uniref:General secretion pathway protein GspI n=2 Tax=Bradyrhizobium betae TaxID=244734 RepID=A0A4Q1UP83_9BRAD|nr:general secretion pathway protein GspI [Bradyrhizobium betae]